MIYFFFIITIILLYFLTKDVFHPAVVVVGLWTLLIGLYAILPHPLWDLSDRFYICLTFWVIPFSLSSYLFSLRPVKLSKTFSTYSFNRKLYDKWFPYIVGYGIFFILSLCYLVHGFSLTNIRLLFVSENKPLILRLLLYLSAVPQIYAFYGVMNWNSVHRGKIVTSLFVVLFVTLFKANKTSFIAVCLGLLYILKRKHVLKFKHFLVICLILIGLLYALTVARGDLDTLDSRDFWQNYVYIYLLSPLTAFDLLINGGVTLEGGASGDGLLVFFYKIANSFGAEIPISQLGEYVYVPLPTNVFTVMRGGYLDGGNICILIYACISGMLFGLFYAWQKTKSLVMILFYSSIFNALFFQSFGDYLFYAMSTNIQYYFFSHIIVRGVKFRVQ